MHKNSVWLAFLCLFSLLTVWYVGDAAWSVYEHQRATESTKVTVIRWSVRNQGTRFVPHVRYRYRVDGKSYERESDLPSLWGRNTWAAEENIKELAKSDLIVWYPPDDPGDVTMEKAFPLRAVLKAIGLVALLIYFIWLGSYVAKIKR